MKTLAVLLFSIGTLGIFYMLTIGLLHSKTSDVVSAPRTMDFQSVNRELDSLAKELRSLRRPLASRFSQESRVSRTLSSHEAETEESTRNQSKPDVAVSAVPPPTTDHEAVTPSPETKTAVPLPVAKRTWLPAHTPPLLNTAFNAPPQVRRVDRVKTKYRVVLKLLLVDGAQLEQCFDSLMKAKYGEETVDIEFWLPPMSSTQPTDSQSLITLGQMVAAAGNFASQWPHGQSVVRNHDGQLRPWIDIWTPKSTDEYALFLNERARVSPLYYVYLVSALAAYRYAGEDTGSELALNTPHQVKAASDGDGDHSASWAGAVGASIYGVSLQPNRAVVARNADLNLQTDKDLPYLYSLLTDSAQLMFPDQWMDFRQYFKERSRNGTEAPFLGNLGVPQRWRSDGNDAWVRWFFRYVFVKQLYSLCPNFPSLQSLALTAEDVGGALPRGFGLVDGIDAVSRQLWTFPQPDQLPQLNFCGQKQKTPLGLLASASSVHGLLSDSERQKAKNRNGALMKRMLATTHEALQKLVAATAHNNVVIMVTVNRAYVDLLYNWLCSVRTLRVSNYIIYTVEPEIAYRLASEGHPVYLDSDAVELLLQQLPKLPPPAAAPAATPAMSPPAAPASPAAATPGRTAPSAPRPPVAPAPAPAAPPAPATPLNKSDLLDTVNAGGALDYGTVVYQSLILARTQLIAQLLRMKVNVLVADVDAVWIQNPLPYLLGNIGDRHMLAQDDNPSRGGVICGGFMFMRNTDEMIALWDQVLLAHKELVSAGIERTTYSLFFLTNSPTGGKLLNTDESEQQVLTKLLKARPKFGFGYLQRDLFPSGGDYFRDKRGLNNGAMVVHNNFLVGLAGKTERFREMHLWLIDDTDKQCRNIAC